MFGSWQEFFVRNEMQKETNEDEEDKLWSEEKDVLVIKSKNINIKYPRILVNKAWG